MPGGALASRGMTPPLMAKSPTPQSHGFGRYAPSPSGRLHVGNLRTALLAWLIAHHTGRELLLRFEDLDADRCSPEIATEQKQDLSSLGITWPQEPVFQSLRTDLYKEAIATLRASGLDLYPCWCTRADLALAAPHDPQRPYPGSCRNLSEAERKERFEAEDRKPALRVDLGDVEIEWDDMILGPQVGRSSDPIIQRADGAFTYNLAVVVDDSSQGVDQIVRGDDLASSVPVQAALYDALASPRPTWGHVPLVLDPSGSRLSKRVGSTTLESWGQDGTALSQLGASLGLCNKTEQAITSDQLLERFDLGSINREPWTFESE